MRFLVSCILFVSFSSSSLGQIGGYERILVPIHISGETPGAHESRWTSRAVGHNRADRAVPVRQSPETCAGEGCPSGRPNSSFSLDLWITPSNGRAALLWIGRPENEQVSFNLRIQDLSRQALTWGTEIPVVRESEAFTTTIDLLNIPTDSRFRQALRIYELFPETGSSKDVAMRIYPLDSNQPIVTESLRLQLDPRESPWTRPLELRILDLVGAYPVLTAFQQIRIEIEPLTPGMRFWSFVSVTNNDTQHVTTITPQ